MKTGLIKKSQVSSFRFRLWELASLGDAATQLGVEGESGTLL